MVDMAYAQMLSTDVHLLCPCGADNESLREGAALSGRLNMRPAFLLDIDCDLYSSTKQALRFMLQSGLLVPGSFVYYDDYDIQRWNIKNTTHRFKEERLAHEEVTSEFQLEWAPLFNYGKYLGPTPGLDWIRQWTNKSRVMNRRLQHNSLAPVLQLRSCGACPSRLRRR